LPFLGTKGFRKDFIGNDEDELDLPGGAVLFDLLAPDLDAAPVGTRLVDALPRLGISAGALLFDFVPDSKLFALSHPTGIGKGPPPFLRRSSNILRTLPPTRIDSPSHDMSDIAEAKDEADPPREIAALGPCLLGPADMLSSSSNMSCNLRPLSSAHSSMSRL
jgi:hypothetical protein